MADYLNSLTDGPTPETADYTAYIQDEARLDAAQNAPTPASGKGSNRGLSPQEKELQEANIRAEAERSTLSRVNQFLQENFPDPGEAYKRLFDSLAANFGSTWPEVPEEDNTLMGPQQSPRSLAWPSLSTATEEDSSLTGGSIPTPPRENVFTAPLEPSTPLASAGRLARDIVFDPLNAIAPGVGKLGTLLGAVSARRIVSTVERHLADGRPLAPEVETFLRRPNYIFEGIEQLQLAGRSDAEIISAVNADIANSTDQIAGIGRFNQVFGGVRRSANGMWQLELADVGSRLNTNVLNRTYPTSRSNILGRETPSRSSVTVGILGDFYEHPSLYLLEPDLQRVPVTFERGKNTAAQVGWDENGRMAIDIVAPNAIEARSALVHEIQHLVSRTEGFAPGGSVRAYLGPDDFSNSSIGNWLHYSAIGQLGKGSIEGAKTLLNSLPPSIRPHVDKFILFRARQLLKPNVPGKLVAPFTGDSLEELAEYFARNPGMAEPRLLADIGLYTDEAIYSSLIGEVEARAVSNRRDMFAEYLRRNPAYGFDTPIEDQILAPSLIRPAAQNMAGNRAFSKPEFYTLVPEHIAAAEARGFVKPDTPATPGAVMDMLNDLGLQVTKTHMSREGVAYISFADPRQPRLPGFSDYVIRVPSPRNMHQAYIREAEQGVLFDAVWARPGSRARGNIVLPRRGQPDATSPVSDHKTDAQGRPYGDLNVLREAIQKRFADPEQMAARPAQAVIDRARELRDQGLSFRKIGDELGYSAPGIKFMLERQGQTSAFKAQQSVDRARAEELWNSGRSVREIAAEIGTSHATVINRLREAGVNTSGWKTDRARLNARNKLISESMKKRYENKQSIVRKEKTIPTSNDTWLVNRQRELIQVEDTLRAEGKSPKEIASAINARYKEGITAEDISSGTAWWRDPNVLAPASAVGASLAALAFPKAADAAYIGQDVSHRPEDQEGQNIAAMMERNERAREDIYTETGWWRNPEGKWRKEIIHQRPTLNFDNLPELQDGDAASRKLSEVIDLKELFEVLPHLRDMPLRFERPTGREYRDYTGWYRAGTMHINMNSNAYRRAARQSEKALATLIYETIVHEVTHFFQDIQGDLPDDDAIAERNRQEKEQGLDDRTAWITRPWEIEALEAGLRATRLSPTQRRESPPPSAQLYGDTLEPGKVKIKGKKRE